MKKEIILHNILVEYIYRKSRKNKYVRLSYNPSRGLSVSVPPLTTFFFVERFLRQQSVWILATMVKYPLRNDVKEEQQQEYLRKKEEAKNILSQLAHHYAIIYKTVFHTVSIRNQRSRWGSCSRQKNLNFHYRVAFMEIPLRDYIVVHEICHLLQMNHSERFWTLVAQTIPDFKIRRKELRKYTPLMGIS